MPIYRAVPGEPLPLGRRYEHNATVVEFDISAWIEEFGAGSVRLLHQRQGDAAPYPVEIVRTDRDGALNAESGALVLWHVSRTDTAQRCQYGKAELRYYAGTEGAEEFLVKSDVYKTVVLDALGASLADAPEGEEDWLAALLGAVNEMEGSVSAAQTAADNAQSAASAAADDANTAYAAAIAARAAQEAAESAAENGGGTITEIRMNGASKGTSGVIDLGTVLTEHQSLADYATKESVNAKADATTVNALIGSDAGKSARTIANEELTAQLIPANAQASLDTLQEIAAWIQNHPNDAAAISRKLTLGTVNGAEYATVKAYVEAVTDGLIKLTALSASASGNGNAITGVSYDNATGAFAFTKGATFLTEHQDISGKVDKVSGKGLSTNDYTTAEKNAVATIGDKVDKVSGKGLSTNDYTTAEKNKLSGIEAGANHTTIDAALSNSGQAADAKAAGDAIAALEAQNAVFREYFANMDAYRTASGNPVVFSDGAAANVKNLRVTITPTRSGSGEPSPDNVRPIVGVSSVAVTRTGKNLWGGSKLIADITGANPNSAVSGTKVTYASGYNDPVYAYNVPYAKGIFRENTRYTFVMKYQHSGGGVGLVNLKVKYTDGTEYRMFKEHSGGSYLDDGTAVFVSPAGKTVLYLTNDFHNGSTTLDSALCGIFEGAATLDEFEAYRGQTVTVTLTDGANPLTVYGGALDVTTGTLTVTHGNIASYNGETVPDGWISSTGQLSTGAQVVYPLATPQTYQLTPAQLATLAGYNAVSADAGTIELTYRADVALSLEV